MLTHAELFNRAHQAHVDWQVDRPLIDKFNHSNLRVALKLLGDEIEELNGGDHTGIFSTENIEADHRVREDYRQQEIADIVVFAMTAFDELKMEIDVEGIYEAAQQVATRLNFELVEPGRPMNYPVAIDEAQNESYKHLRRLLNQEADFLLNYDESQRELLPAVLENVLIYAVAMHSLLGVDSGRAVIEKVARNMLKYPAEMFTLPDKEFTAAELEVFYNEQRNKCADEFDGPRDLATGERPKLGTTDFYQKPLPIEVEPYQAGEIHQIGIFYRAVAQVIASTYGFSVKVSNLLNRA